MRQLQQGQKQLEGVCKGIVEQEKKVMAAVTELKVLVEEQTKKNFSIKGTPFEVSRITILTVELHSHHHTLYCSFHFEEKWHDSSAKHCPDTQQVKRYRCVHRC